MKWYLDEGLSAKLAAQLRRHGVDAVSAHEVGMRGSSDAEQLLWATRHGRILVTYNISDYVPLLRAWPSGRERPAVAWFDDRTVRQHDLGAQVRAILKADREGRIIYGGATYLMP